MKARIGAVQTLSDLRSNIGSLKDPTGRTATPLTSCQSASWTDRGKQSADEPALSRLDNRQAHETPSDPGHGQRPSHSARVGTTSFGSRLRQRGVAANLTIALSPSEQRKRSTIRYPVVSLALRRTAPGVDGVVHDHAGFEHFVMVGKVDREAERQCEQSGRLRLRDSSRRRERFGLFRDGNGGSAKASCGNCVKKRPHFFCALGAERLLELALRLYPPPHTGAKTSFAGLGHP